MQWDETGRELGGVENPESRDSDRRGVEDWPGLGVDEATAEEQVDIILRFVLAGSGCR
jgi:hypothetical protein